MTTNMNNLAVNLKAITAAKTGLHVQIATLSGITKFALHKIKRGDSSDLMHSTMLSLAKAISTVCGVAVTTDDLHRSPDSATVKRLVEKASKYTRTTQKAS